MKRIEWIDIFKGILIILVVFGHATQGIQSNMNVLNNPGYESVSFIKNMIYSFHMPAFFIASGLLFNSFEKKLNIEYLAKKVKKIAYPYFVWSLITAVFMQIAGGNTNSGLGIKDFLYSPVKPFSQYWYLYVYLFLILTYAVLIVLFKNKAKKFLFGLGIITYLLNPLLPDVWIVKNYCNYLLYFALGLIIIKLVKKRVKFFVNPLYAAFSGILFIMVSFIYAYELIIGNSVFAYFLWLIPSFLGTLFFINVSINLKNLSLKKMFTYFGKNSLKYYVMHLIPLAAMRIILLNYIHIQNLWIVVTFSFIVAIFTCFVSLLIMKKIKVTKLFFS